MGKTRIPYATDTWDPVTGCPPDQFNAVCQARCWAARMARQRPATHGGLGSGPCPDCDGRGYYLCSCYDGPSNHKGDPCRRCKGKGTLPAIMPVPFSRLVLHPDRLDQPLHWRKPRVVLVASRGDLFHDQVPDRFICDVVTAMECAPQHTYLLCTKRIARARQLLSLFMDGLSRPNFAEEHANVWLLASVCNQEMADRMIPELLATPVAHRGVSYEPALGPVDFSYHLSVGEHCTGNTIDWVVAGCVSGTNRRPAPGEWFDALRAQCKRAGVPFYVKQQALHRAAEVPREDGTGKLVRFPPQPGELPWRLPAKGA